jgi:cell division protein FtsN
VDKRYGKGNRGSDLPYELRRRQDLLARIRQACKEIEAETAAVAARQWQQEAEEAKAIATAARESDAPAADQAELTTKADAAAANAEAAREKAIEDVEDPGLELPDLKPLAAEAMPRRRLARKADSTPNPKPQSNFTDSDSHLMQSGGAYLQGYNCQLAVDSDH